MIYVQYDIQSSTGLQTWIDKLSYLTHIAISVFDPQFNLIVATGGTDTKTQAREWHMRHPKLPKYPDIRLLDDETAEIIGEVVSDKTPIAYVVISRFYFDSTANPHVKQFKDGMPVYDDILAESTLSLISFGVKACLRELVVIDPDIAQKLDDYIYSNLNQKITLVSVSCALHIPINELRIYLQSEFNCNLPNYLRMKKIEAAKKLLIETDLSLAEISEKIGMDKEQWTKLFKKQTSLLPEQYRKENHI